LIIADFHAAVTSNAFDAIALHAHADAGVRQQARVAARYAGDAPE